MKLTHFHFVIFSNRIMFFVLFILTMNRKYKKGIQQKHRTLQFLFFVLSLWDFIQCEWCGTCLKMNFWLQLKSSKIREFFFLNCVMRIVHYGDSICNSALFWLSHSSWHIEFLLNKKIISIRWRDTYIETPNVIK